MYTGMVEIGSACGLFVKKLNNVYNFLDARCLFAPQAPVSTPTDSGRQRVKHAKVEA